MDAPAFSVVTVAHFDSLLKKLAPKHFDLVERFEEAIGVLSVDPPLRELGAESHFPSVATGPPIRRQL
jgi:hypothetical protein